MAFGWYGAGSGAKWRDGRDGGGRDDSGGGDSTDEDSEKSRGGQRGILKAGEM